MSSLFSVTFKCFQFYLLVNVSINLLQRSNFQASKLFINVPGPFSGVPDPGFHLNILGSCVQGLTWKVPGPGSYSWCPGLRVSCPTYPVCRVPNDNNKFWKSVKSFRRSAFYFYQNTKFYFIKSL